MAKPTATSSLHPAFIETQSWLPAIHLASVLVVLWAVFTSARALSRRHMAHRHAWALAAVDSVDGDEESLVAAPSKCEVQLTYRKRLQEGSRPLVEYVQLPAKRYSVLDSDQVTRVSDDTFRVRFGDLKMLKLLRISPSAEVTVDVPETGAVQRIRGINFEGNPQRLITALNGLFAALDWTNVVSAERQDDGNVDLVSAIYIEWDLPPTYPLGPAAMNSLVARLMNYMMPWMLNKLAQDYDRWSAGDDSRVAVSRGELAQLTIDFMSENPDLMPGSELPSKKKGP